MTNKERQKLLDESKWNTSKMYKKDCSGEMPYCIGCPYATCTHTCKATQAEREEHCLCAKSYNCLRRISNGKSKRV